MQSTLPEQRRSPVAHLTAGDPDLQRRFDAVREFARTVRVSEYHITNACNIRCKGCWFFQYDFDKQTKDERDLGELHAFIDRECQRGINCSLLIGGEPVMFPERIAAYVARMQYVVISSNGLLPLPREGFEKVTVAVTLFGGGPLDDELRGVRPSGKTFTGLLDTALTNYRNDSRVCFIYAITETGIPYIEDTVRRIRDNGSKVTFNFYSQYHTRHPLRLEHGRRLLDEALRVQRLYPDVVLSTPYYIETMIMGKTHWGSFGYDTCPSVSADHPAHAERLANGNRALPMFNTWAPDLKTINFCCTSGHCEDCRDSQAVYSWLMVSADKFMGSTELLRTWVELAESYWGQFCWSPVRARAHSTNAA